MTSPRPHRLQPDTTRRGTATGLLDRAEGHTLALFRMVVGLLFACHGAATLFDVFGGPHSGEVPAAGTWPDWWAAVIQLVGGVLVGLGLVTRRAAVICSGSMAYAYFSVHQPDGLLPIENGGEASAMFCWAFLLIALLGPGRWALDSFFRPVRSGRKADDAVLAS